MPFSTSLVFSLGRSRIGLASALRARLLAAGTVVEAARAGGFAEVGGGVYRWTGNGIDDSVTFVDAYHPDFSTTILDSQPARTTVAPSPVGDGANLITVTVRTAANVAAPNVAVRVSGTATSDALTDANGVARFAVANGVIAISVSAPGYLPVAPVTRTIVGNLSEFVTISPISTPAPPVGHRAIVVTFTDPVGDPAAGECVRYRAAGADIRASWKYSPTSGMDGSVTFYAATTQAIVVQYDNRIQQTLPAGTGVATLAFETGG